MNKCKFNIGELGGYERRFFYTPEELRKLQHDQDFNKKLGEL